VETFHIVLGAILAIAGGVIARFFDSRLRRKDKRNELLAERELDACVWIYPLFKLIMFYLDRENPDFQSAKKLVSENNARFWDNRLLLPPGVPEDWIACRNAIANGEKEKALDHAQFAFPKICKTVGIKEFP